jgi:hypothetical protein
MDYKEFLSTVLNPAKNYRVLYDRTGKVQLILNREFGFLTENEMLEYALMMPLVYDHIKELEYDQLIDANVNVGGIMRNLFGLFSKNNPNTSHSDDPTDLNSPENVSYRLIKIMWYNSHRI